MGKLLKLLADEPNLVDLYSVAFAKEEKLKEVGLFLSIMFLC